MYSTCLFCHATLGSNEAIEHFPVGRRLAFDAAKGRLWVVCRKCERWNLTPVEERWEAIEECERLFRETKLRVSTENIGLGRVREGIELVRVGSPQRPEMAAWRYGDQFDRRRRRYYAIAGVGAVAVVGVMVAGPLLGIGVSMINLGPNLYNLYRMRAVRARVLLPGVDAPVPFRTGHLNSVRLEANPHGWQLRIKHGDVPVRWPGVVGKQSESVVVGEHALRIAGQLLPKINAAGATKASVAGAVRILEQTPDPNVLLRGLAQDTPGIFRVSQPIAKLPLEARLAMEMALHEDTERRALEGELALLENAWKEAEEIAAISDSMFVAPEVEARLGALKNEGTREERR